MSDVDLGRVGIWTFALNLVPSHRAAELVRRLEELGYGTLWMPDALARDPLVQSALLLSDTQTLRVGTGIASIYGRDAVTMAAGWRTVSEAFPGRFVLGLGVSHAPMVEGLFQREYARPVTTMRAYLERMDAAPFMGLAPPVPPRRVLAALGPRMLALAAEKADGAHPYLVTPEHSAFARERLGPGKILAPEQGVVLERDPAEARRIARAHLAIYLSLPNYVNNFRRLGFTEDDASGGGSDRLVDGVVAWGGVEDVAARVRAHHAAGADHVALQVLTPDPQSVPLEQWEQLAASFAG
ncbi:MAG: LLM class F420-dependent oxidoreductase [Actinobacteria bacterium]|nr:LLM class F420-dependent oxidoreductase [Actinomycetota bacterium]